MTGGHCEGGAKSVREEIGAGVQCLRDCWGEGRGVAVDYQRVISSDCVKWDGHYWQSDQQTRACTQPKEKHILINNYSKMVICG